MICVFQSLIGGRLPAAGFGGRPTERSQAGEATDVGFEIALGSRVDHSTNLGVDEGGSSRPMSVGAPRPFVDDAVVEFDRKEGAELAGGSPHVAMELVVVDADGVDAWI